MGYPAQVTTGNFTDTHTTARLPLGTVGAFVQNGQQVLARYMENGAGATLAAGFVAGYADNGGRFDTAGLGSTLAAKEMMAGVVPVSRADGDFGWVVFRGPLTAGQFQNAATYTSSAAERWMGVNAAARVLTVVSSIVSTIGGPGASKIIGLLRSTAATVSSGAASTGILDVLWR